ncbi:UbiH/UbiF/VisC/COQ6 family ubiquinone biosynthesis hydroxylase [Balneatrix alpica]|uniref:UbiH/UbiF/VisC/COQ6 family ubiquinone biosynthesis hydroxylase n=1 Tax=Balneatrix alpica TaxID=75684 RepID=A0ABV5ZEX6_9GAMM|nr:UbiH/UbiF/VisC/COQ6 family ubiquinone biosynthesis hydroxylase [Balneatrix alpica]
MKNEKVAEFDLIVVGAGMVGAAAALGAARQGWQVALVDPQPLVLQEPVLTEQVDDYDLRVSALTESSRQLLEHLGVWGAMQGWRVCPYRHMRVWDGEGTGAIEFNASELQRPNLGHIVENRVTQQALWQAILQAGIAHFAGKVTALTGVQAGQRQLQLDTGVSLQARLIVGADGALSSVRRLVGIPLLERDYGHHALVASIALQQSHDYAAWQRFMPTGPLAILPFAHPQHASIVWSTLPEQADALLALSAGAFATELTQALEGRLGQVQAVSQRMAVPLRMRHAQYYWRDGVVLLGDAAHTIHPLAGQGVNLGFKDVMALLECLAYAWQRQLNPGMARILARYQRQRKLDNWLVQGAMGAFKQVFASRHPLLTLGRNLGLSTVNDLPLLKQQLAAQAMGLH